MADMPCPFNDFLQDLELETKFPEDPLDYLFFCTLGSFLLAVKRLNVFMEKEEDGAEKNGGPCYYLPSEILVQIFFHLPCKSVKRLACVCKSWREMLSDPFFLEEHRLQSREKIIRLRCEEVGPSYDRVVHIIQKSSEKAENEDDDDVWKIRFFKRGKDFYAKMLAANKSSMVCFVVVERDCGVVSEIFLFLCNPSLRRLQRINTGIRVRNYPDFLNYSFGFVYNSETNLYTVVVLATAQCDSRKSNASVMTLGVDRNWRKLGKLDFESSGHCVFSGKGITYWRMRYHGERYFSFDTHDERFRILPRPPTFPIQPWAMSRNGHPFVRCVSPGMFYPDHVIYLMISGAWIKAKTVENGSEFIRVLDEDEVVVSYLLDRPEDHQLQGNHRLIYDAVRFPGRNNVGSRIESHAYVESLQFPLKFERSPGASCIQEALGWMWNMTCLPRSDIFPDV